MIVALEIRRIRWIWNSRTIDKSSVFGEKAKNASRASIFLVFLPGII